MWRSNMLLFLASFFALALLSSAAAAEGGEKEEVAGRAEDPCDAWIHRYFNKKSFPIQLVGKQHFFQRY